MQGATINCDNPCSEKQRNLHVILTRQWTPFGFGSHFWGHIFWEGFFHNPRNRSGTYRPSWLISPFSFFQSSSSLINPLLRIHFHLGVGGSKVKYPFLITCDILSVFTLIIVQGEKMSHSSKAIHFVIVYQNFWYPSRTHLLLFQMVVNHGQDGSMWQRITGSPIENIFQFWRLVPTQPVPIIRKRY